MIIFSVFTLILTASSFRVRVSSTGIPEEKVTAANLNEAVSSVSIAHMLTFSKMVFLMLSAVEEDRMMALSVPSCIPVSFSNDGHKWVEGGKGSASGEGREHMGYSLSPP